MADLTALLSELDEALLRLRGTELADRVPLQVHAAAVGGEPVSYDQAERLAYAPFTVGDRWGGPWDTWWFRLTGEVPHAWAGRQVVVRARLSDGMTGFGGEGLLWRDGTPVAGVAPRHGEYVWTERAVAGEQVALLLEAAANPQANLGAVVPDGVRSEPLLYTLDAAELATVDADVRRAQLDLTILSELARAQPDDREVAAAVEAACRSLRDGDLRSATDVAANLLGRPAAANAHRLVLVGNAHIDTAWLWPYRETRRKIARTLATALTHMERWPEYRFALSQPQQVAWLAEDHPQLYDRLREAVVAGRVQPVGAMWVEPDCNVPGGESLVRQLVEGKRFWQEHFGVDARECWLPDAFGYPAALPQLLAGAGVNWFVSQKLSWNDTNRFPHQTFRWRGVDGTEVLAHFPPADTYNGRVLVDELLLAERNAAGRTGVSMYLYGYGDGGGGPTPRMLERARRLADVRGLPRLEHGTARDFLDAAAADADRLPVWSQELYFEKHRGTYTTHAWLKRSTRRLEHDLLAAERWALLHHGTGETYPRAELRTAWRSLLTSQFHDVLPGTSIGWVYRDAAQQHLEVAAVADQVAGAALDALAADIDPAGAAEPVVAFNAGPFDRQEVADGEAGPLWVDVPAYGYAVADAAAAAAVPPVRVEGRTLDNGLVRVTLDAAGHIVSLVHTATGRDAIAPGARANVLQLLDDRPAQWDAWDIDAWTMDTAVDVDDVESLEVVEQHPLRASIRVVRRFGASRAEQTVTLRAGSPRVDLHTRVGWHEDQKLLKVAYPVDVRSRTARCEIQYGHVERATHRDTPFEQARFEVCAHRWVELSEAGFGVALLNDGRYGFDVRDNVVRMSLLRSPLWPDPAADRGVSEVRHALLPHAGDPWAGRVVEEAYALNVPLRLRRPAGGGSLPARASYVRSDTPGLVVEAVKAADEGDGVVVRVYEAFGGRRRGCLQVALPVATVRDADLLERPVGDPQPVEDGTVPLDLRPFEVRTLLLR